MYNVYCINGRPISSCNRDNTSDSWLENEGIFKEQTNHHEERKSKLVDPRSPNYHAHPINESTKSVNVTSTKPQQNQQDIGPSKPIQLNDFVVRKRKFVFDVIGDDYMLLLVTLNLKINGE